MTMQQVLRGDGAIRRESPYGSSKENTYAGVVSFMRRLYTKELRGVDLAVTGVPLDIATTNRPGARLEVPSRNGFFRTPKRPSRFSDTPRPERFVGVRGHP